MTFENWYLFLYECYHWEWPQEWDPEVKTLSFQLYFNVETCETEESHGVWKIVLQYIFVTFRSTDISCQTLQYIHLTCKLHGETTHCHHKAGYNNEKFNMEVYTVALRLRPQYILCIFI
jgi:hypothetical protein